MIIKMTSDEIKSDLAVLFAFCLGIDIPSVQMDDPRYSYYQNLNLAQFIANIYKDDTIYDILWSLHNLNWLSMAENMDNDKEQPLPWPYIKTIHTDGYIERAVDNIPAKTCKSKAGKKLIKELDGYLKASSIGSAGKSDYWKDLNKFRDRLNELVTAN